MGRITVQELTEVHGEQLGLVDRGKFPDGEGERRIETSRIDLGTYPSYLGVSCLFCYRVSSDTDPVAIFFPLGTAPPSMSYPMVPERSVPSLRSNLDISHLHSRLKSILRERIDGMATCHASLVAVHGRGALLVGSPGAGKTTLAITLVSRGHGFVGDDRIIFQCRPDGLLEGRAHPRLRGMIHLRGKGIQHLSRYMPKAQLLSSVPLAAIFLLDGSDEIAVDLHRCLGRQRLPVRALAKKDSAEDRADAVERDMRRHMGGGRS